ncbi:MAG: MarR family winged helix-turn-helix transcriptional regulator [Vicinamibacterales bacterium]
MSATLGVTGPQRLVLRVVGIFPGVSAGGIAGILHVHPSTLTGILHRLVRQKLLARSAHPDDRRRLVLHLTRRGERVNALTSETAEAAVARALQSIGPRDAAATRRALTTIADRLEALGRRPVR